MDLDKLVKVLNERQSVNEMPFGRGVEQADTEAAAKTPEELAKLKAQHKAERAKHEDEGDSSTRVGYAKRRDAQDAGVDGVAKTRSKSQNSSTEYEGPFLDETTKKRIEAVAQRMIAKSKSDAEEEKKVPGTTPYGEGHAAGEHVAKKVEIETRAKKLKGRLAARQAKTQNSSTEYEGPSLAEQVDFIKTFLEGKTTGGDPEATGARMGSFIKRIRKVAPKSGLLQKKEQQASRIAGKMAAKASRQSLGKSHASFTAAGGSENSSTEYEGPSLSEQSEFIKTFLDSLSEELTPWQAEKRAKEKFGSKKETRAAQQGGTTLTPEEQKSMGGIPKKGAPRKARGKVGSGGRPTHISQTVAQLKGSVWGPGHKPGAK